MFYKFIRQLLFNFSSIEKYIPRRGEILDVGCGHGLLASRLAENKQLQILGIDPSSAKIKIANNNLMHSNINYKQAYLGDLPKNQKFDCICITDVAYLVPKKNKAQFFKDAFLRLKKGGVLILKEVDPNPKWMHQLLILEETLMTKVFKYTHNSEALDWPTPKEYQKILENNGFKVTTIKSFYGPIIYPHQFLLVANKYNEKKY